LIFIKIWGKSRKIEFSILIFIHLIVNFFPVAMEPKLISPHSLKPILSPSPESFQTPTKYFTQARFTVVVTDFRIGIQI